MGLGCLVRVSNTRHATHHAEHVVAGSIDTDLGGGGSSDSGGRKHKLKGGVINAGEVATARRLVLLGAKGEGIHVDTGIRGTGVVLERLDNVEVSSLTLGEAVLAVKLKLGSHHRVLTPAVHVKGGLGKHEGTGVRHVGTLSSVGKATEGGGGAHGSRVLEKTTGGHEAVGALSLGGSSESMDSVGKSIDGISVVERLGTKGLVKGVTALKRGAVINVGIRLHNPDELLTGVVEVQLDLVTGGAHRLVTSELKLLNEVLVGVLGHLAALIGIKEDIINVQRSGDEGLLVGGRHRLGVNVGVKRLDGPQALTDGAEVNVDLHLVVLQGNEGKGQTGVAAEPEKKGDVKGGLRESLAGSAHLVGASGGRARTRHIGELGVSDVGKLGGVTNHLVVTLLLLGRHGKLVPDVHEVTVLTVNALTTNLDLNLGDELLTGEIQPAGIHIISGRKILVDLGESHLEVGAVAQITVAADGAGYAASEVGLTRESLLDGLHSEVGVASVRHLPEGNFGGSSKENVLGAVGDKLHESSSHFLAL